MVEENPDITYSKKQRKNYWRWGVGVLKDVETGEYSIVEQLKKVSAHVFNLSLLMIFEAYRNALIKVSNELYVPSNTNPQEFGEYSWLGLSN